MEAKYMSQTYINILSKHDFVHKQHQMQVVEIHVLVDTKQLTITRSEA